MINPKPTDSSGNPTVRSRQTKGRIRPAVDADQASPAVAMIISGGQTGADRAALDWALANRIPHGGWCPRGRLAEDGIIPDFYKLRETVSTEYAVRTERNIRESDGTVIFTIGKSLSGGSRDTAIIAAKLKKPWVHLSKTDSLDPGNELRLFMKAHRITVLNVAGTRASKEPLIADFVKGTLRAAFSDVAPLAPAEPGATPRRKRS